MFAKRIFDLPVVIFSAPIWVPLLGALALAVRSRLGRPVFFRQARPGRNEEIFELLKFRTMTDARDTKGELLPDEVRSRPSAAGSAGPRSTNYPSSGTCRKAT